MLISCDIPVKASLDDGLTVTTFPAGENDVPDSIAQMAIKHFGAKKVAKSKSNGGGDVQGSDPANS